MAQVTKLKLNESLSHNQVKDILPPIENPLEGIVSVYFMLTHRMGFVQRKTRTTLTDLMPEEDLIEDVEKS